MKHLLIPLAAACTAALAPAQSWIRPDDDGANTKPVQSGTVNSLASWSDNFNRADGPIGGPWNVVSGTWAIVSNQGAHTSTGANEILQHSTASGVYRNLVVELDVLAPGSAGQFSGVLIGLGGSDTIQVKIQDQVAGTAGFSNIGIYHRTSATGWGAWTGTGTGFAALTAPFTAGRLKVYFSDADTLVAELDTDFNGAADQTYSKTGVLALAPNLGTGVGITAWGSTALFDNFSASNPQIAIASGDSACLSESLDFDSPFVASGPIGASAAPFVLNGIGSVRPFGVWTAAGDAISAGSNDSGQSLVVQGSGTLAVAGVGEPLSNAGAGAGFDIQLNRPVRSFGWLFVDQINFGYQVELFSGGNAVAFEFASYSGSFPAPPVHVSLLNGCAFDRVRISFTTGGFGVGIDRFRLDDCYGVLNAGGPVPAVGSGDGTYPTTLPTAPMVSTLILPSDARSIETVTFVSLAHTWSGDLQAVLVDPSGVGHVLFNRIGLTSGACCGNSGDFTGSLRVVESGGTVFPASGNVPPDTVYDQYFGTWPSGANGIFNTPLSQVPVIPGGIYTLRIYDWAGGDSGTLASWGISGKRGANCTPFDYCAAGTSSSGCVPTIGATANPNVALTVPCVITANNIEGQKNGLLFYGLAPTQSPWCAGGSSFLCVKAPTQRTINQVSGGTAGQCNGVLSLDWNAYQAGHPSALGNPFTAGDVVYVQGWFRDPTSCKTTSLTGGLGLTYQP